MVGVTDVGGHGGAITCGSAFIVCTAGGVGLDADTETAGEAGL